MTDRDDCCHGDQKQKSPLNLHGDALDDGKRTLNIMQLIKWVNWRAGNLLKDCYLSYPTFARHEYSTAFDSDEKLSPRLFRKTRINSFSCHPYQQTASTRGSSAGTAHLLQANHPSLPPPLGGPVGGTAGSGVLISSHTCSTYPLHQCLYNCVEKYCPLFQLLGRL